ncbi:MAG: GTPase HflX [candidate division KSB1 bacterium]|nr:GTPase HflX [candidate division KSB1 bacterium]
MTPTIREKAVLVGVVEPGQSRWEAEEYLEELAMLADTAGADVVGKVFQDGGRLNPAYLIGRGKVEELVRVVQEQQANLVIFDHDLTPVQVKNLEKSCGVKILDRSGLILDIFARRARTKEAKTQVELAQLKYLLPRLTRQWTHLSRQYGGIGTRGPGETQLEVDRRMIRRRIAVLDRELDQIRQQRQVRRRHRSDIFKAALVGYTNVGKSSLLNALTDSQVFVEDRLFATLDATVRAMRADKGLRVLLIDTVGFIRKLPHHLVASFMSTLEEAAEADLLLHVVDVSHPQFPMQIETVNEVLKQLELHTKPMVYVFNKIDAVQEKGIFASLREQYRPAVFVSATRGMFLQDLRNVILEYARRQFIEITVCLPAERSAVLSLIDRLAEVRDVTEVDGRLRVRFLTDRDRWSRLRHSLDRSEYTVADAEVTVQDREAEEAQLQAR